MKRVLGIGLIAVAVVVLTFLVAGPARQGACAEPSRPVAAAPGAEADPAAKSPVDVKRQPVPDEASQAEILQSLKELFKKEIENKQPYARLALAAHLVRQAREAKDKPADQYVMFRVARDLSVQQGDALLAVLAADELVKRFDIPAATMKAETLDRTLRQAKTPAAAALVTEAILSEAERAAILRHTRPSPRYSARWKCHC